MRLLADLHIAPRTVAFLQGLGHDVVRVTQLPLRPTATDAEIVAAARDADRTVLTQDLDFTDLVALSGETQPSIITLRLSTTNIEHVNAVLARALPGIEADVRRGALVTVQDSTVRRRLLPFTP